MTYALLALAAILSPSDPEILQSIAVAIDAPAAYVSSHETTAERFAGSLDEDDKHMLPWVALADELMQRGVATELDWRTGRDALIWSLQKLNSYSQLAPETRRAIDSLSVSDNLTVTWLRAVASAAEAEDMVVATMDIGSDSYVILMVTRDTFVNAVRFAKQLDHRLEDIRAYDPGASDE